jgi:hypothetical protein
VKERKTLHPAEKASRQGNRRAPRKLLVHTLQASSQTAADWTRQTLSGSHRPAEHIHPTLREGKNALREGILRGLCVLLVLLSLLLFARFAFHHLGGSSFDDAYMFTRYAKHWLAGHGFSWNIGEGPAYGCTSTLYLFVITLFRRVSVLTDGVLLRRTSALLGLLFVVSLFGTCYLVVTDVRLRRLWVCLLVFPAVLLRKEFLFHCFTGMETTLALCCNTLLALLVILYSRRQSKLGLATCLMSAYCAFLARPDSGLYGLLLPPLFFWATGRELRRSAILYVVLFGCILGLDGFLKNKLFGYPIPLPFLAKRSGFYVGYLGGYQWNAGKYLVQFARVSLPFLVIVVLFVRRHSLARTLALLTPMVLTFLYLFTIVQIMGFVSRLYYPSLPFLASASFLALDSGLSWKDQSGILISKRLLLRIGIAALLAVFISLPATESAMEKLWAKLCLRSPQSVTARTRYITPAEEPLPKLGWWPSTLQVTALVSDLPEGASVAMSEYGLAGSFAPEMRIIDMVGLHDKQVAQNGFTADYLFSLKPDLIWLPHTDYAGIRQHILDCPDFYRDYAYYPTVFDYGIAVRTTSKYSNAIDEALRKAFNGAYPALDLKDYLATPVHAVAQESQAAAPTG